MNQSIVRFLSSVLLLVFLFLSLANQVNTLSNYNRNNKNLTNEKTELETKRDTLLRDSTTELAKEIESKRDKKEITQAFVGEAVKLSTLGDVLVEQQKLAERKKGFPAMTTIVSR